MSIEDDVHEIRQLAVNAAISIVLYCRDPQKFATENKCEFAIDPRHPVWLATDKWWRTKYDRELHDDGGTAFEDDWQHFTFMTCQPAQVEAARRFGPKLARRLLRSHNAGDLLDARHGPEFRSVSWFGTEYAFSEDQAKCVAILWRSWRRGTPDVPWRSIRKEIDSTCERFRDLFRRSAAYSSMIVEGSTRGTVRLNPPPYFYPDLLSDDA